MGILTSMSNYSPDIEIVSDIIPYRIDDIPLLLALMRQITLDTILDGCVPTHGNTMDHNELTNGEAIVIWLIFLLSQADHRKVHVEDWVRHYSPVLSKLWGAAVLASDFSDDRLSTLLTHLSKSASQEQIDKLLFQQTVYVYDLYQDHLRLDATVCGGFHEVEAGGLMQLGHSKDGRADLAQFKLMAAATGTAHYISGQCSSGEKADDPLYLPLFQRIVDWLPTAGMLFVGDCKMCALTIRAAIVQAGHDYYMPLAQNHVAAGDYTQWIDAAVSGSLAGLTAVWREEELLGYGYEFDREQSCGELQWMERVQIIRSIAMIEPGVQAIARHVARATQELYQLTPAPRQGRPQINDEQQLEKSVAQILHRHDLAGAITVTWRRDENYKKGLAVRWVVTQVEVDAEKVRDLQHQKGWRVFVSNTSRNRLPLDQGVLLYRKGAGQGIERMYAMLKGTPIGISPLFVHNDDQILGLAFLLTLALRVMSYFESSVREALEKTSDELPDYHPGGKSSAHPTAKTMLGRIAKRGFTLVEIIRDDGASQWVLSKPPPILQKIMELLKLPASTFEKLIE